MWLKQASVPTVMKGPVSMPGTKLTWASVCAWNVTCPLWPGTRLGTATTDVMGVRHQQITCRWDKTWIPINQFLSCKILSSEGTDLTTYFEDNEKICLLSICHIPTQSITVRCFTIISLDSPMRTTLAGGWLLIFTLWKWGDRGSKRVSTVPSSNGWKEPK